MSEAGRDHTLLLTVQNRVKDIQEFGTPNLTASLAALSAAVAALQAADVVHNARLAALEAPAPRVQANATGTQSVPDTTTTTVQFAAADSYDTDSMHDPVTNNSRITFATAGLYLLLASVQLSDPTSSTDLFVRTTRTATPTNDTMRLLGSNQAALVGTLYQALVGDYAELRVYHDSGADNVIEAAVFLAVWLDQ